MAAEQARYRAAQQHAYAQALFAAEEQAAELLRRIRVEGDTPDTRAAFSAMVAAVQQDADRAIRRPAYHDPTEVFTAWARVQIAAAWSSASTWGPETPPSPPDPPSPDQ
ncbi:hypothetical protein ACFQHO_53530 [Actinomadura yumaensis]|uniref:hypothetical protein n=1 Tax=Actinomadura yumaensis TaxID=111807 RepID=UPI00361350D2